MACQHAQEYKLGDEILGEGDEGSGEGVLLELTREHLHNMLFHCNLHFSNYSTLFLTIKKDVAVQASGRKRELEKKLSNRHAAKNGEKQLEGNHAVEVSVEDAEFETSPVQDDMEVDADDGTTSPPEV